MTDKELIDWLELQEGCGLISDDFGHWAVTGDGMQNVPDNTPTDIQTTFFISKEQWKPSIREAILSVMEEWSASMVGAGMGCGYAATHWQPPEEK